MHYEVPSLSSMLYEFTNREQDLVNQAFRTGNYINMRDLPENIAPNNVLQQLHVKMRQVLHESTVNAANKQKHLEHLKGNGGFFMKFEGSESDPFLDQSKIDRPLKPRGPEDKPAFNPGQVKRLLKYEYPFGDDKDGKFVYGFLCMNDPYEATRDEKLRAKWIEEAKLLYGEFKPAGPQKPLSQVSKSRLEDIVESLKRLLLSDWNDVNFVIGTNPND